MKNLILLSVLCACIACKQDINSLPLVILELTPKDSSRAQIEYHFDKPDDIYVLEPALREISGLEYDLGKNCLLTHNDEHGYIFELNIDSGQIINKIQFAESGDYEGVAYSSEAIYVAKHTGKIFVYDPITKKTESHKTPLSARNDVEGLCVDKRNNKLLLACKGEPLPKKKHKDEKCIYAFDLSTNKLVEDPVLTIKDDELVDWVKDNYRQTSKKDQKNKIQRIKNFSPSGLSFTNSQNALYVISARGSTLLIFDITLNLKSIHFLNTKTLPQPEGICFDKDNNLYISTEGQGFSGKIFKYKHHG